MTNCDIKLELNGIEAKIANIIENNVGTNKALYNKYLFGILDNNATILSTEFKQYAKDNYNIDINNSISKINNKDLFSAIKGYVNSKGLDVESTALNDKLSATIDTFGYNSLEDRKFCINMAAQLIQDFKYQNENKYFRKIKGNKHGRLGNVLV